MPHPLIGLHATLGEIGIFAFLLVFVELLNPSELRIKRAKIASLIGLTFFILSWIIGGYYYVSFYGTDVKPVIKEGPQPWAHSIVMEAKEHIFLFLPFLAVIASLLIMNVRVNETKKLKSILKLSALIIITGFMMALMGYVISTGFRGALEVMHIK